MDMLRHCFVNDFFCSKFYSQKFTQVVAIIAMGLFLGGCGATRSSSKTSLLNHDGSKESLDDTVTAVGAVAGAVSGQDVSGQKLRDVARQVQKDPEAREAVEAIGASLGANAVGVKYCPVDGKRYAPRFSRCPEHNVDLKEIVE